MKITDQTTAYQVAELLGTNVNERDGRIMLALLRQRGITDTDDLDDAAWFSLLDDAQATRDNEDEAAAH